MDEAISKALEHHSKAIDASASEMQRQIQEAWAKTEQAINDRFETFDEQMQQELSRAMETMGRNLASLSEKFVADYTPLPVRIEKLCCTTEKERGDFTFLTAELCRLCGITAATNGTWLPKGTTDYLKLLPRIQ